MRLGAKSRATRRRESSRRKKRRRAPFGAHLRRAGTLKLHIGSRPDRAAFEAPPLASHICERRLLSMLSLRNIAHPPFMTPKAGIAYSTREKCIGGSIWRLGCPPRTRSHVTFQSWVRSMRSSPVRVACGSPEANLAASVRVPNGSARTDFLPLSEANGSVLSCPSRIRAVPPAGGLFCSHRMRY